jgi:ribosomal protein S18 acetylase RimI-like enzyme
MDLHAVLRRYDERMRREAPADGPGARVERDGQVVRQIAPDGNGWHGVLWSGLDETTADAAIAGQVRAFARYDRPFEWKVYDHDLPADLSDRLRRAGFVPEPAEALMVADVSEVPTGIDLPEGVRLHTVTGAADVDLLVRVHDEVFGDASGTDLRPWMVSVLETAPETAHLVVAMAGARPVSAARSDLPPGGEFAGLWGGGTLPEWRGRGLYRALVAARARHAAQRGYRYLQVDASDESRPILQRLGFRQLSTTTPYVFDPAGAPA